MKKSGEGGGICVRLRALVYDRSNALRVVGEQMMMESQGGAPHAGQPQHHHQAGSLPHPTGIASPPRRTLERGKGWIDEDAETRASHIHKTRALPSPAQQRAMVVRPAVQRRASNNIHGTRNHSRIDAMAEFTFTHTYEIWSPVVVCEENPLRFSLASSAVGGSSRAVRPVRESSDSLLTRY